MEAVAMVKPIINPILNNPNSKTLREWREERGLSQVKLAAAADTTPARLIKIEQSFGVGVNWSADTMRRIAQTLGVGVMDIVEFRVALGYPA